MSSNTSAIANDGGGTFTADKIGSFSFGVGVSVGLLILITTVILASYFCSRTNTPAQSAPRRTGRPTIRELTAEDADIELGIDEATLMSYPKVLYSQAKLLEKRRTTTSTCCSICLADYKNSDVLRELPDCSHLFHLKCVDPWLRLHPTCPVCRTSPLASPLPTPLAEVLPLARQHP